MAEAAPQDIPNWNPSVKFTEQAVANLINEIWLMTPTEHAQGRGIEKLNIFFLGPQGVGKSATVQNIDTCFYHKEEVSSRFGAVFRSMRHVTHCLHKFPIFPYLSNNPELGFTPPAGVPERQERQLPFLVWDSVGMTGVAADATNNNLDWVLRGCVPDGFRLETDEMLNEATPGFNANPGAGERVHAVAVVVSALQIFDQDDSRVDELVALLKPIMDRARARGRDHNPIAIITHCDDIDHRLRTDPSIIFTSAKVHSVVTKIQDKLEVDIVDIWPIVNYHAYSAGRDVRRDALTLRVLRKLVMRAIDYTHVHC